MSFDKHRDWSLYKLIATERKLRVQYTETSDYYHLFAQEGVFQWKCILSKGTSDALDFENNYKDNYNQPIAPVDDEGVPTVNVQSITQIDSIDDGKFVLYREPSQSGEDKDPITVDEKAGSRLELAVNDLDTQGKLDDVIDAIETLDPNSGSISRPDNPVQEGEFNNTDRNKIEYTVPTGKVLYITSLSTALGADGGTIVIEWQNDGSAFHCQTVSDDGDQYCYAPYPKDNPLVGFNAGDIIRARRVYGDSGKNWSASFAGYLEDV